MTTQHELACPDCGTTLVVRQLENKTYVCHCQSDVGDCRAGVMGHGSTADEAADKFVARCERFGYTDALERKLAAIAEGRTE